MAPSQGSRHTPQGEGAVRTAEHYNQNLSIRIKVRSGQVVRVLLFDAVRRRYGPVLVDQRGTTLVEICVLLPLPQ